MKFKQIIPLNGREIQKNNPPKRKKLKEEEKNFTLVPLHGREIQKNLPA